MRSLNKAIEQLEDALKSARMENASFGFAGNKVSHPNGTQITVDELVKEETRLYMNSWVAAPINHALTILKAHKELLAASEQLKEVAWRESPLLEALERMRIAVDAAGRID